MSDPLSADQDQAQDLDQEPMGQEPLEDDGVLQPGDSLETDDLASDPLDTGVSPPERKPASERFGVTLAEARSGESLDQRLEQEEPDVEPRDTPATSPYEPGEPAEPRAGRLVSQDEGDHPVEDPVYLARDAGVDGGAAGAEEAAVHVIDEEPGGTD
ncbi:MAG TPA: DUF5709 domain-containing protein [Actinocrinis sp.]|jgi:hypothetical protein